MKLTVFGVCMLIGSMLPFQQQAKKPLEPAYTEYNYKAPTLSVEDKLSIRTAQLNVQRAYQDAEDTPQWKAYQAAVDKQNATLRAIDDKYEATKHKLSLCDGPKEPGPCATVGKDELVLMPPPEIKLPAEAPKGK